MENVENKDRITSDLIRDDKRWYDKFAASFVG